MTAIVQSMTNLSPVASRSGQIILPLVGRGDGDSHWQSGDFGNRIAVLKLPFSLFLALRYLKPKRTFISIITLVSVLGVTLGVTVLILVISVMTGFDRELRQKVIDFDAHILVTTEDVMRNWRDLTVQDSQHAGRRRDRALHPGTGDRRISESPARADDPRHRSGSRRKRSFRCANSSRPASSTSRAIRPCSVSTWRRNLASTVGDKLTVYSPGNLGEVLDKLKDLEQKKGDEKEKAIDDLREVVLPKELTVTGIFETGQYLHDSEFLLVPIFIGQELYGLGDALHGITVKTVDPYDVDRVKHAIEKYLKPPEYASDLDRNEQTISSTPSGWSGR